ncbi:hypothetical protein [Streptomyces carminius]|uniref:hypothetical protein n=1 Tax=Streptomyces carminius TaxID=2665496 RepID=UPI0013045022|nr:hypothetical protein [Streptomyces carminius]
MGDTFLRDLWFHHVDGAQVEQVVAGAEPVGPVLSRLVPGEPEVHGRPVLLEHRGPPQPAGIDLSAGHRRTEPPVTAAVFAHQRKLGQ